MITLCFIILLFAVVGNILGFAIKAAWGIAKIAVTVLFFPLVLAGLALSGFIGIAFLLLIVMGIVSLFNWIL